MNAARAAIAGGSAGVAASLLMTGVTGPWINVAMVLGYGGLAAVLSGIAMAFGKNRDERPFPPGAVWILAGCAVVVLSLLAGLLDATTRPACDDHSQCAGMAWVFVWAGSLAGLGMVALGGWMLAHADRPAF